MNDYVKLGIGFGAALAVLLILWKQGYLAKLTAYVKSTQEELKRCTWPTWAELKGSTIVVFVAIFLLGVFTVGVDTVVSFLVKLLVS